jgi:hypothetical protein
VHFRPVRSLAARLFVVAILAFFVAVPAAASAAEPTTGSTAQLGWRTVASGNLEAGKTSVSLVQPMDEASCSRLLDSIAKTSRADCVTRITFNVDPGIAAPLPRGLSTVAAAAASCGRPQITGSYYHVGWNARVTQWFWNCWPNTVRTDGTNCGDWSSHWPYSFTVTLCGATANKGTWAEGGENATVGGPFGSTGVGYRIKMTNKGIWSVSCWGGFC